MTRLINGRTLLINGWGARPGTQAINEPSKAINSPSDVVNSLITCVFRVVVVVAWQGPFFLLRKQKPRIIVGYHNFKKKNALENIYKQFKSLQVLRNLFSP